MIKNKANNINIKESRRYRHSLLKRHSLISKKLTTGLYLILLTKT